MYDHKCNGEAGDCHFAGIVDVLRLCPVLDHNHQRLYPPVQLGVCVQEVSVSDPHRVVNVKVTFHTTDAVTELQNWHFCIDQLYLV